MLVQIENEFGHFGDAANIEADRKYLELLARLARKHLGTPVATPVAATPAVRPVAAPLPTAVAPQDPPAQKADRTCLELLARLA